MLDFHHAAGFLSQRRRGARQGDCQNAGGGGAQISCHQADCSFCFL